VLTSPLTGRSHRGTPGSETRSSAIRDREEIVKRIAVVVSALALCGILSFGGAAFAGTVITENTAGKVPIIIEYQKEMSYTAITNHDELEIGGEVSFAPFFASLQNKLQFLAFTFGPGATYPAHSGPDTYVVMITEGSGTMFTYVLDGPEGKIATRETLATTTPFVAGDTIVFRPDVVHGWEAGPDGFKCIVTVIP
jgi:quercetin dioxygenase-like cupin family protein